MGKNIFATITYVAEKIVEAITGHNSKVDAHPSLVEQINVLSGEVINEKLPQPKQSMDIRLYLASLKKNEAYYVAVKQEYPLLTNIPVDIQDSFSIKISGGVVHGGMYYAKVQIASLTFADVYYECSIYNNTEFSGWTKFSTTTKTDISFTPSAGHTVESQKCYIQNDRVYFNIQIKRTDGGLFPKNQEINLGSITSGVVTTTKQPLTCSTVLSGYLTQGTSCELYDGVRVFLGKITFDADTIHIGGSVSK